MQYLDADHVEYAVGRGALYFETDVAWLCGLRAGRPRCFAWPRDLPRITRLHGWDSEGTTHMTAWAGDVMLDLESVAKVAGPLRITTARCVAEDDWNAHTKPPSRRGKAPTTCAAPKSGTEIPESAAPGPPRLARAFARLQTSAEEQIVLGSAEHQGSSLFSLGSEGELADGRAWTCHRPAGQPRLCGSTRLADLRAIKPEATLPEGWLVISSVGSGRQEESHLVWVAPSGGKLTCATLTVGGVDGYGEDCEAFFPDDKHPPAGYCVLVAGSFTPFELISPLCVRVEPTIRWSAVHVRAKDRWVGERILKPQRGRGGVDGVGLPRPPNPGTYRPDAKGWRQAACAE